MSNEPYRRGGREYRHTEERGHEERQPMDRRYGSQENRAGGRSDRSRADEEQYRPADRQKRQDDRY